MIIKVDLTCDICGAIFCRAIGEANRSKRSGRPIYCSRTCAGKANRKNIPSANPPGATYARTIGGMLTLLHKGRVMILPSSSHTYNQTPQNASLDRIDSSKGYTAENIQFVSYMANVAKNDFTHQEMVEFCQAIGERYQSSTI